MIEASAPRVGRPRAAGALDPQIDHRLGGRRRDRAVCPVLRLRKPLKAGINGAGESIRIIRVYTRAPGDYYLTVTGMASQE